MDQGISTTPSAYLLRLALVVCGVVFGLLVLSFLVGGSSASAAERDEPDSLGGLVGSVVSEVADAVPVVQPVTQPVVQVVQQVADAAPATTAVVPVAAVVDEAVAPVLETTGLDETLGTSTPVGAILTPVAELVDTTLGTTATAIGPVVLPVAQTAADAIAEAPVAATPLIELVAPIVPVIVSGAASGQLGLAVSSIPLGAEDGLGGTASTPLLAAALAGAGFLVLLARRRQLDPGRAMPGSPVFETDSSPD